MSASGAFPGSGCTFARGSRLSEVQRLKAQRYRGFGMYRHASAAVLCESSAANVAFAALSPGQYADNLTEGTRAVMAKLGPDVRLSAYPSKRDFVYPDRVVANTIFAAPYGAYDLLQGIYNLNVKPIPGKYQNGVTQDDKYFSPKGMARSGVR